MLVPAKHLFVVVRHLNTPFCIYRISYLQLKVPFCIVANHINRIRRGPLDEGERSDSTRNTVFLFSKLDHRTFTLVGDPRASEALAREQKLQDSKRSASPRSKCGLLCFIVGDPRASEALARRFIVFVM